jgi:Na+-driven multidrug efflux pump
VIPAVFGADWLPVVPLLQALVGVVLGMSLLATLKFYLQATRQARLLLPVRVVQFSVLFASCAFFMQPATHGLIAIAYALSLATLAAAATAALLVRWRERDFGPLLPTPRLDSRA